MASIPIKTMTRSQALHIYNTQKEKLLWETKEGTVVRLVDMDTGHLQNTLTLLQRKFGDDSLNWKTWITQELFERAVGDPSIKIDLSNSSSKPLSEEQQKKANAFFDNLKL